MTENYATIIEYFEVLFWNTFQNLCWKIAKMKYFLKYKFRFNLFVITVIDSILPIITVKSYR